MSTIDELRRTFAAVGDVGLEGPEAILRLQRAALERDPPPDLPEVARSAAVERIAAGRPVVERERFPYDGGRVAELMARLAHALLGDPGSLVHERLADIIAGAFAAGAADDGAGVRRALEPLALPPETAESLLREALKPEMLRTALPLAEVVESAAARRSCPVCGSRPSAAAASGEALCSWCGTTWRRDAAACPACGGPHLKRVPLRGLVGAELEQCRACGEALGVFDARPEALGLSLFAVLAAPLRFVARVRSGAEPETGFRIF